jgi:hypothetical protein
MSKIGPGDLVMLIEPAGGMPARWHWMNCEPGMTGIVLSAVFVPIDKFTARVPSVEVRLSGKPTSGTLPLIVLKKISGPPAEEVTEEHKESMV